MTRLQQEKGMTSSSHPLHSSEKGSTGRPQPPAKPHGKPRTCKDFGEEGTNKTIPVPRPDGAVPEELGITPHVEKSPYTRG